MALQGLDWSCLLVVSSNSYGQVLTGKCICVVSISPTSNAFRSILDAVHLFSVTNDVIKLVSVWKELYTSSQEPDQDKIISKILLCILCILCIIAYAYYACYACYVVYTNYANTYCSPRVSRFPKSS